MSKVIYAKIDELEELSSRLTLARQDFIKDEYTELVKTSNDLRSDIFDIIEDLMESLQFAVDKNTSYDHDNLYGTPSGKIQYQWVADAEKALNKAKGI